MRLHEPANLDSCVFISMIYWILKSYGSILLRISKSSIWKLKKARVAASDRRCNACMSALAVQLADIR